MTPEASIACFRTGASHVRQVLDQLDAAGIQKAEVTLHVGAGTFQPVRVENIADHTMHSEHVEVDQTCVDAVHACRERGGRVVAIGTTAVRSLESAARQQTGGATTEATHTTTVSSSDLSDAGSEVQKCSLVK